MGSVSATAYLVRVPEDFVITELHEEIAKDCDEDDVNPITLDKLNQTLRELHQYGCIDRSNGDYCMSPAYYMYLHLPSEMIIKEFDLCEWNDVMINLNHIEAGD